MENTLPDHGGNLDEASRRFGIAPEAWLDLSTGVNPLAYPVPQIEAAIWQRLPDRGMIERLEQAALTSYGVAAPARALAAAGSAALIHLLPLLRPACRVHIAGPTFAEHRAAWEQGGHDVHMVRGLAAGDAAVMIVVNPNNPGAEQYQPEHIVRLAGQLAARGGFLVVDEAFADPHPQISVAHAAGRPGLIVLRSFGKFFGLAGLRLGFALAAPGTIAALRRLAGPWPVSGPAALIGTQALADREWIDSTRGKLRRSAARMAELLQAGGLNVAGQSALFTLLDVPDAARLHQALAQKGIWTRIFPDQPRWLRIGLPGGAKQWRRLETTLSKLPTL